MRRAFDDDGVNLSNTLAKQIMNLSPKTIKSQNLAIDALSLMEYYQITGLFVVDKGNHLIGAFNLHDLFKAKLI